MKNKVKLFEKFIIQNTILFLDNEVYNKWDSEVDLLLGFPKNFQKYIKKLLKEQEEQQ